MVPAVFSLFHLPGWCITLGFPHECSLISANNNFGIFLGIILALLIIVFFPLIFLPYLNSFFRDVLEKVSTAKYFAE